MKIFSHKITLLDSVAVLVCFTVYWNAEAVELVSFFFTYIKNE